MTAAGRVEKVWPIVTRHGAGAVEVLAFEHPTAGHQFVKGTSEPPEAPDHGARRELKEESGLWFNASPVQLGRYWAQDRGHLWHFYWWHCTQKPPERWRHQTEDDFGHVFQLFWHPLSAPLDDTWHVMFHEAFAVFAPAVRRRLAE